jgi:hypothetical protein
MKNSIVRQFGAGENDVILFLHTPRHPSSKEWDDALSLMRRYAVTADFRRLRVFVVSDGGGPDAAQRGALQEFFKSQRHSPKCSVITTSVIGRGIIAAVSWFNPHVKAFSPRGFTDAIAHIDLPRAVIPRLLREFSEMERELSPNSCLALITGASASVTL